MLVVRRFPLKFLGDTIAYFVGMGMNDVVWAGRGRRARLQVKLGHKACRCFL